MFIIIDYLLGNILPTEKKTTFKDMTTLKCKGNGQEGKGVERKLIMIKTTTDIE